MRRRARLAAIAMCGCLVLSACGGDESAEPSPTPTATAGAAATTVPPIEAGSLTVEAPVWTTGVNADDGSPLAGVEWFPTDVPSLYAVFATSPIVAGTEFAVSWTMNGTPVPGLNPSLQIREDTPAGWIEFHLDRTGADRWPDGILGVALSVGGEVVAEGEIELRD